MRMRSSTMFCVIFVPVGCTVLEFSSVLSNVSQCGEIEHARITAKLFGLATALNWMCCLWLGCPSLTMRHVLSAPLQVVRAGFDWHVWWCFHVMFSCSSCNCDIIGDRVNNCLMWPQSCQLFSCGMTLLQELMHYTVFGWPSHICGVSQLSELQSLRVGICPQLMLV